MAASAPEKTYERKREGRESSERDGEPLPPLNERTRRRRARAEDNPLSALLPEEDQFGSERTSDDREEEPEEPGFDAGQARRLQSGYGNGYLAAAAPPKSALREKTTPEAVERADRKQQQARRSDEPEYAQSVSFQRPERGEARPPAAPAPAERERPAEEGVDPVATAEKGVATLEEAAKPAEEAKEEEPEGADGALEELKEETGEAEEKAGGEEPAAEAGEGGGAAPAIPAGVQAAQSAMANVASAGADVMAATQRPVAFAPAPEEVSNAPDVASRGAAKRRASEGLAEDFVARNAHQVTALLALASTAPARIFAASEIAKASVDAAVAANIATVEGAIGAAMASAQKEAATATAVIQAQRAVTLVTVTVATLSARVEIEALFTGVATELTTLETTQVNEIAAQYRDWEIKLAAVGQEIGNEGMATALERGREWLALRNGESSILDGPIHDNRLEAKADAAKEVAQAYTEEFKKAALEQTGQVMAGQPEVMKYIADSATQVRDSLTKHHDAILEALTESDRHATEQINQLADSMIAGIASSLASTRALLTQQRAAETARLQEYAITQKVEIDDQAGQAAAALLDGGAAAAGGFSQSIREFLDSAVGMAAPDSEELGPALAGVQAQTDRLAETMLGQMEQGIAASEAGVFEGGARATASVDMLGQSAREQAAAVGQGYAQRVAMMLQQATQGFTQLREGHQETAEAVKTSAKDGIAEATKSLKDAFSSLSKNSLENFSKAREEMRAAMRKSLHPQIDTTIKEEADKAAAAVQPRWKSVLKWIITIVVIVAVVALTIVSAGSLGVVGTIVLGAALGATAGAATQIGHNLVDGKKWSDGVGKAMVVGAIGGAFGGIGGALAGKVASVGLKFGIEAGVDVVGGIVGDLVVGNPITVQGVLFGAAIGAGVGLGVGIAGALKGKIKLRPSVKAGAPGISSTRPSAPAGPKSKVRSFLETTTVLKKTPDFTPTPAAKPHAAATPEPHVGAKPAAGAVAEPHAAPKADAGAPRAETPTPKADAEGPGATGRAAEEPAAVPKDTDAPEPGVRSKATTPDGAHEVKVTESGKIVRCTTCAEVSAEYAAELASRPALRRRIEALEARAKVDDSAVQKQVAQEAAALEQSLRGLRKNKPAVVLSGKSVTSRKDLERHLDAIIKSGEPIPTAKRQEMIDLGIHLGAEVNSGAVSPRMKKRLERALLELDEQNVGRNPVLKEAWDRTLEDIAKVSKKFEPVLNPDGTIKANANPKLMKELYAFARGKMNTNLNDVSREIDELFGIMTPRVSELPANVELHHLLYKAKVPAHAVTAENIVLALRKKGGAQDQLHDLLHFISCGAGTTIAGKNRWRTLLVEMEDVIRKVYRL